MWCYGDGANRWSLRGPSIIIIKGPPGAALSSSSPPGVPLTDATWRTSGLAPEVQETPAKKAKTSRTTPPSKSGALSLPKVLLHSRQNIARAQQMVKEVKAILMMNVETVQPSPSAKVKSPASIEVVWFVCHQQRETWHVCGRICTCILVLKHSPL